MAYNPDNHNHRHFSNKKVVIPELRKPDVLAYGPPNVELRGGIDFAKQADRGIVIIPNPIDDADREILKAQLMASRTAMPIIPIDSELRDTDWIDTISFKPNKSITEQIMSSRKAICGNVIGLAQCSENTHIPTIKFSSKNSHVNREPEHPLEAYCVPPSSSIKQAPRNIVRFEGPNGTGIFNTNISPRFHEELHDSGFFRRHTEFNAPQSDPGIGDDFCSNYYCAYKSIEEMQRWITNDEIKIAKRAGVKILLLTVTDYMIGKDQAVYTKESIIETKDIADLF